jgi:hypothetical protein
VSIIHETRPDPFHSHPLGDDSFVDMLELKLNKVLRPLKQGRKRKSEK